MKQPSQRQLRVAEQIRGVISETLHRGHFHEEILVDHAADVTVSGIDVSPDLKNAKIYVMSLHETELPNVLAALNDNAYYFQKEINHKLNIKFTPKVRFFEDESFAEAQRIEALLNTIK
jgi:ribosome-binding factor A